MYDPVEEVINCTSFDDLLGDKNQQEWISIIIKNNDNHPMQVLNANVFRKVTNAQLINITGMINNIEKYVFRDLSSLSWLLLYDNNLNEIPPCAFHYLQVNYLSINNCQLQKLNPGDFDKMPNLSTLKLNNNDISNIPVGVFNNLDIHSLDLSNNKIETIDNIAMSAMNKIYEIDLSGNQLKSFIPEQILGESCPVRDLYLHKNCLQKVGRFLTPDLQTLLLSHNNIEILDDQCFYDCKHLDHLNLEHNCLETISPDVFSDESAKRLKYLDISNNKIECLSLEVFHKLVYLRKFNGSGNPWQTGGLNDIMSLLERIKLTNEEDSKNPA